MQRNKQSAVSHETKNHLHTNEENKEHAMTYDFSSLSSSKNNGSIITSNIPETNAKNDITQDFDLRKAIIYSEILKPKFHEE